MFRGLVANLVVCHFNHIRSWWWWWWWKLCLCRWRTGPL